MKILVAMANDAVRAGFIPPDVARQIESMGDTKWNVGIQRWTSEQLAGEIAGAQVCFTGWGCPAFDERVLAQATELRCIAHTGGTVAGYVCEEVYDRGIHVLSGNELYARSVAEGVVAYMLYALRDLGKFNRQMLAEGWRDTAFRNEGLLDQTVGLIGFGAVARHTARLLRAFGCRIRICADHVSPEEAAEYGAEKAGLDEIMSECKIISIHLARVPETYHIIDEGRLAMIRDDALLINTARGSIIDENALAKELAKGRFRAVLDVYEQEPLPMDSPLRKLDNAFLIPHMAGPTADRYPFITRTLIENVQKVMRGEESEMEITREMMRRMTH